jgi:predicted DNA-binding transcriptional regulator YafY
MIILDGSKATERAALIAYLLASGRQLSTADIVEMTGVPIRTAQRDFVNISRAIPIYRESDGQWSLINQEAVISPY